MQDVALFLLGKAQAISFRTCSKLKLIKKIQTYTIQANGKPNYAVTNKQSDIETRKEQVKPKNVKFSQGV